MIQNLTALITQDKSSLNICSKWLCRSNFNGVYLKIKKIHGNKVLPFLTPTSHELDTIEDLDLLEFQLMKNSEIFAKVFY